MPGFVFWIHPVLQLVATAMAAYALYLAWPRVLRNHFGKRTSFAWAEHGKWGKYAHILWMLGLVGGTALVARHWGSSGATGDHYWIAQLIMPCIAGGYITGTIMDRDKKPRKYMPLVHGVLNVLALTIAGFQIFTGMSVVREFLLH